MQWNNRIFLFQRNIYIFDNFILYVTCRWWYTYSYTFVHLLPLIWFGNMIMVMLLVGFVVFFNSDFSFAFSIFFFFRNFYFVILFEHFCLSFSSCSHIVIHSGFNIMHVLLNVTKISKLFVCIIICIML